MRFPLNFVIGSIMIIFVLTAAVVSLFWTPHSHSELNISMKIYDCFMYFDEDLVLELRLNTLNKYIDYFVIVESSFTHKGEERKLKFNQQHHHNLIHIQLPRMPRLRTQCGPLPVASRLAGNRQG